MSPTDCREGRADARHLLTCSACRTEARQAQAWKRLGDRLSSGDGTQPPSERLVAAILNSARRDRARRAGLRAALAAAAALLFFFLAGLSSGRAVRATESVEESYAGLVSPSAVTVEDLVPN